MRNIDIPARYGGEEFTFILPRTSAEDAFIVAERIRKDIARHELKVGDETINVTASFGIASYPESGRDNHETLLENADFALYRAKEKGRNRTINFQSLTRAEVARLREEKKD